MSKIKTRDSFDVIDDLKSIVNQNIHLYDEEKRIEINDIIDEATKLKRTRDIEKKIESIIQTIFAIIALTFIFCFIFNVDSLRTEMVDEVYRTFNPDTTMTYRIDTISTVNSTSKTLTKTSSIDEYLSSVRRLDSITNIQHRQELEIKDDQIKVLHERLNYIDKTYSIRFVENNHTVTFSANKVDSALLLLPHYGKMIRYDSSKNEWIITIINK